MSFFFYSQVFLSLFLFIYIYHNIRFYRNFHVKSGIDILTKKHVSVVVCARNEEKNIRNLLESLVTQDYDPAYVEIIIANDQSTDGTEQVLLDYSENYSNISYIDVKDRGQAVSPKKNALRQAISRAKGEIILLTDADCEPSPNWISSHIGIYTESPETDMVVGFARTKMPNHTMCQIYEHVDFLILMFAAQGAIQAGIPFSASGQNLSYKKSVYDELNNFEGLEGYISGDDLLLLQKFVGNKKKVKFACYLNSFTETQPVNSWKELFNQRARWASNMKAMPRMNFRFFVYLISCFICIGILPFTAFYLYAVKVFSDMYYILYALESHKLEKFDKYSLVLWVIFSPFYVLIVTFRGMCSIFEWKGRIGG